MAKIPARMFGVQALKDKLAYKRGSVKVVVKGDHAAYSYAGNEILVNGPGGLAFSMAGWPSLTTAARLRANGVPIHMVKGVVLCGNHPIKTDFGVWYVIVDGVPVRTNYPLSPTAHKLGE